MASDTEKTQIATAGNVLIPAYLALQQKGYTVWQERRGRGGKDEMWFAESETARLIAEDPFSLLALAALFETRGEDWKASDEQIEDFIARYCG